MDMSNECRAEAMTASSGPMPASGSVIRVSEWVASVPWDRCAAEAAEEPAERVPKTTRTATIG